MRTSPLGGVSAERLQFVPKKKSLFLFRWGVWFREQQFIVQLRLRLLWGRGVQGRLRWRPDGRCGGQSSAGADDGEGEGARAVQQNWEERGPKEAVSGDDGSEDKQESCCRTHKELRAEKWNKKRQTTVLKDFISLFENNTGDGFSNFLVPQQKSENMHVADWHFNIPLCAFNYSRLRLSVLTDLKLRRSWRRQRRRRRRRRKRSRRKSKKKGSYLRFKTHKWWVWGLFKQY